MQQLKTKIPLQNLCTSLSLSIAAVQLLGITGANGCWTSSSSSVSTMRGTLSFIAKLCSVIAHNQLFSCICLVYKASILQFCASTCWFISLKCFRLFTLLEENPFFQYTISWSELNLIFWLKGDVPETCFKHTKCPFNSISSTTVSRIVPLFLSTPRVADRSHQPLFKGITRIAYQPTSILKAFNQIWQGAVLQNERIMGCSWEFADGICEPGNQLIFEQ